MHTKGAAFLARRQVIVAEFGQAKWDAFIAEYGAEHPLFIGDIEPTAALPMQPFLELGDALVRRFYGGELRTHWHFGEISAEWAFEHGPLQPFFSSRSFKRFVDSAPSLWQAYHDEGQIAATWHERHHFADVRIFELPILHIHFEYNVMGYVRRGLELTGGKVTLMRPLKGIEAGDDEIHYQFFVEPKLGLENTSRSGERELG